ncbi:DUF4268 domain-containing protein [Microbulbifer pacificus]|uniref:DUF4268 domain-containing protein n=1 Tax=Microbulbifer pacificus TaxID=407164 RepID=A0AAU0MUV9_9GAMM|nr:DUF4268 domain-containing protein [Microbulbifer pacificus]WOX04223.1 DUF4268 domain-containing protein [Microbulbifer pacificus]
MYQIDKSANRIFPLQERKFSELGFRERDHLQEWIATNPEVLGEELLIIQKEFDGFDETRERLDLLALDKQGHLVVIENKLDDSGRDVTWQALKYASYCAGLTKSQIVAIYQKYLDKYEGGDNAQQRLADFFNEFEFDELILNPGSDQRIIFVAANFRREVTSTALWLMEHRIRIQCIKAVPFAMGDQLLLKLDQIIPVKEAEEYMIGISEKKQEEQSNERTVANRHLAREKFWRVFIDTVRESDCRLYDNVNPSKDGWSSTGSGLSGVVYIVVFGRNCMRVEFVIARSSQEENKYLFDKLASRREELDSKFGAPLDWERLDNKKACRISYEAPADGFNSDEWPRIAAWLTSHISRIEKTFRPEIPNLKNLLALRQEEVEEGI